jgi:hypothetical protein
MRRFGRLQARCQTTIAPDGRFLREKFSSRTENPHGFELPRTLSCRMRESPGFGIWPWSLVFGLCTKSKNLRPR